MLFRLMICSLLGIGAVSASSQPDQRNTVVGTWRGESKCLVTPSQTGNQPGNERLLVFPRHSHLEVSVAKRVNHPLRAEGRLADWDDDPR